MTTLTSSNPMMEMVMGMRRESVKAGEAIEAARDDRVELIKATVADIHANMMRLAEGGHAGGKHFRSLAESLAYYQAMLVELGAAN